MAANQKGAVDKTTKPAKAVEVPELDASKTYTVIGTGNHLPKDSEHSVGGADAMLLIQSGRATLKDK